MKNIHGKHIEHKSSSMPEEVFKGTIASAIVYSGSKFMTNVIKNPVLVFGLGVVAGFFVHKYRKEIIANTTKVIDAGRDFVLQQNANLEDIVAETKE